ncbi:MAG: hypothetical protein N2170_05090 [Bacteroidia bacterium]|nr:hypothetical protein [Bacteroidia bacterium]
MRCYVWIAIFIAADPFSGPLLAQNYQGVSRRAGLGTGTAYFRENRGQVRYQNWLPRWDILYSGEAGGLVYHLRADGLHYELIHQEEIDDPGESTFCNGPSEKEECHTLVIYRVDVEFIGCKQPQIKAEREVVGYENFYNTPSGVRPALFVRSYERVRYEGLWEGINVVFYRDSEENSSMISK